MKKRRRQTDTWRAGIAPRRGDGEGIMADQERKGFSKEFVIIIVMSVLFALFFMLPSDILDGLGKTPIRARVSRVRVDMRTLAIALEAYFDDHGRYPPMDAGNQGPGGTQTYNCWVAYSYERRDGRAAGLPGFLMNGPDHTFATLTTPQAYITTYPSDPFASDKGSTFLCWPWDPIWVGDPNTPPNLRPHGWILISPGPDLDYDLADPGEAYSASIPQPSPHLLAGTNRRGSAFTYDPTNGAVSNGDVWRVKQ
jgi:type II secretory pathway pseudopilin PulG